MAFAALDDRPIADAKGPGHLVGVCAVMEGHALEEGEPAFPLNSLEGDEMGFIDGEPSLFGTGTEDYFNSSFYYVNGPFANAFAQTWDLRTEPGAPPHRMVSSCRWHVLTDAIDFESAPVLDLEIGANHPQLLDEYRTVACVYR